MSLLVPVRTVVFVGNSLTGQNDVAGRTARLLSKCTDGVRWEAKYFACGHLDDAAKDKQTTAAVGGGAYAVVLQAQKISMSHRVDYSHEAAETLATMSRSKGSRVFFFAEWPRRGVDETAYIEDIYRAIATKTKSSVVPVGRVWDRVLQTDPKAALFSAVGNHATVAGSALAATVIARCLLGAPLGKNVAEGVPADLRGSVLGAVDKVLPTRKNP
ncbi:MAG: hypothetical protein KF857_06920 [Fimbriimonadaceae bacterium]|nr:hypothetical protein [Fimbriimonadaceae bacterium]